MGGDGGGGGTSGAFVRLDNDEGGIEIEPAQTRSVDTYLRIPARVVLC